LHICCMLHSPARDSGRTTTSKSRSPLRKQAIYEASTDDRVCKLTRWISSYRQASPGQAADPLPSATPFEHPCLQLHD
jgi:hypothetical protein